MRIHYSKKTIISILTALSISFVTSICLAKKDSVKEYNKSKEKVENLVNSASSTNCPLIELTEREIKALVKEYFNYFSSINVEYPHDDLYPSKKELDLILFMDSTYQEYNHENTISMDELFDIIKQNSLVSVTNNGEYQSAFISYEDFQKSYRNQIDVNSKIYFEAALKLALKDLEANSTNDFLEDICRIKNLKIVFRDLNKNSDDFITYGQYGNAENLIDLDNNAIEQNEIKESDNKLEKYLHVLKHELSHVIATPCNHRLLNGQSFHTILGSCGTLIESSAESSLYALDNSYNGTTFDYTYLNEREEEALILLLGLFHDDKTYNDYYNAISDANPNAFYEFCGVKTEEEKYILYKILSAMDGKNLENDIAYEARNSEKMSKPDAEKIIRYNYKLDIFHKVLSNMVNYTSTYPDFTIEENLQMLNIVESCILDDNNYLNKKNSYDKKFIKDIYKSETKYLEFLSQYYFNGKKDINFIKKYYENDYLEPSILFSGNNFYYRNDLINSFPLLKPIIYTYCDSEYNHQNFLISNEKLLKKIKTK